MGVEAGESVVHLEDVDGREAGKELFKKAYSDMARVDFGFLFAAPGFDLEGLASGLDERMEEEDAEWVGASTAGEISDEGSTTDSAVLMLAGSPEIEFTTAVSRNVYSRPVEAGEAAAREVVDEDYLDSERHRILFALMAGLTQRQEGVEFEVLKGITGEINADIPVSGGSAGDNVEMRRTYQFLNGEVYDDAVVLTAIESDYPIRRGQAHGFDETLKSGMVSESDGRVIKEINGRPAAEFYADVIGKDVSDLKKMFDLPLGRKLRVIGRYIGMKLRGESPLNIHRVFQYSLEKSLAEQISPGNYRIVTPLKVTRDNGLVMTSEVEETQSIHVVEAERDRVVEAARDAFDHVEPGQKPLFGIVTDCTNRNQIMTEEEREREIRMLRDHLECPVAGFYGYGEIGGKGEEFSTFKNQTVTGFVFTER
ncbi:MAG: FIST signal transduction protein [Candidatus Nanohaloarchaea archaeon]